MKPTIVIFSAFYEPYMSGAELAVKNIVERLASRYNFIILTARLDKSLKSEKSNGYEIRRIGWGKLSYFVLAPFYAMTFGPKIVHAVMESYGGGALWLYKLFGGTAKTVLTLQSGDLDMSDKHARFDFWPLRSIWKFVYKKIHTSPDQVIAIGSSLAARARGLGAKDVSVIPNGVDFNEINRVSAAEAIPRRIISVARLSAEKGLDYLISAFRDVKNEFPEARLVLVGEGAERGRLERLVADQNLYGAVSLIGRLPHDEALVEIKKSEVFVLASLGEGMGIVLAEAQALGVPVIATRVGGIPDVIEDGVSGLLVQPKDAVAIAAAILKIFRNPELRGQLPANARQSVKKFDWDAIAKRYDAIYQILNSKFMRIILATPIYPPQIGGPAEYVKKLAEGLKQKGIEAVVLSYGDFTPFLPPLPLALQASEEGEGAGGSVEFTGNSPFRHFVYFIKLLALSKDADIVYAFDPLAVGLPAYLVSKLRGIKFVMRLGGDYLWERDVEAGRVWTTLRSYYESGLWKKHKVISFLLKRIFAGVDQFIFTTDFLAEIYKKVFKILEDKIEIIKNPFLSPKQIITLISSVPKRNDIIFAGRFIRLKNLDNLILAFKELKDTDLKLRLIGDGPQKTHLQELIKNNSLENRVIIEPPMSHDDKKYFEIIAGAKLCVLPSLSEVSPNFALECISLARPILLTKENGLGINHILPKWYLFDPAKDNLNEKVEKIFNYPNQGFSFSGIRDWELVINDNYKILCQLLKTVS